jgi:hypothetical protein
MDWSSIGEIFVGVIAGGMISAYFSWRGSKELRHEASDLRQLNYQLIRFLEDAGTIKNAEWKYGKPTRIVAASATISGSSSMTVRPTVIRSNEQDDDREGA